MSRTRRFIGMMVSLTGLAAMVARADEYGDAWGPAVGAPLPVLEAPDQTGRIRTLDDLAGEQGLLLFLNRSADW